MPTILETESVAELSSQLATAHRTGARVDHVELRGMGRVLEHAPEDMTVTVEAGITLSALQDHLREARQWLPLDPAKPETTTIATVLSHNLSGPRRQGFGTARDWVIGLKVVLADGTLIRSGGKVVKNVAGYDLAKLFIGGRGTLGVIVEATFKLRPLPEQEAFVAAVHPDLDGATTFVDSIRDSKLNPVVLDLHRLDAQGDFTVVLGFSGSAPDVQRDMGEAKRMGAAAETDLGYESRFWEDSTAVPLRMTSVLPTNLNQTLRELHDVPFVARAGSGVVCWRGGMEEPSRKLPRHLFRRIKDAFDPKGVFPDIPA